jgi:hypothetical protein
MRAIFIFSLILLSVSQILCTGASLNEDLPPLTAREQLADKMTEARRLQGNSIITDQHIARRLKSTISNGKKWRRMKIWFDLTDTFEKNPKRKDFYEKVYEIVGKWWESAVWINDSKKGYRSEVKRRMALTGKNAKYAIPDMHITKGTYKDYDLLVQTNMKPDDGGTLAFAGPVWRHPETGRPITGEASVCWFGDKNFYEADDAVNAAVATIVHEFGHVMAFIQFKDFHKHYTIYSEDIKKWMWTGDLVRKSAANFYGCTLDKMKGMALETFSKKTEGAHWLEATTDDELMSPIGGEEPEKVSPMMMAFLEDTHWYKSDYSVVENYMFHVMDPGHCSQKMKCPEKKICKLGEEDFVTSDFKGLGKCEKNEAGCPSEVKWSNRNVYRPAGWNKKYRQYGAVYSDRSIIVQGRFIRWDSDGDLYTEVGVLSAESWCKKKDLTEYWVSFKEFKYHNKEFEHRGDIFVKCTKNREKIEFNCNKDGTWCSHVICYDPKELCTKTMTKLGNYGGNSPNCDRSCMKNGRCRPGIFPENTSSETLAKTAKKQLHNARRRLARARNLKKIAPLPKEEETADPELVKSKERLRFTERHQAHWLSESRIHCGNISKTNNCGPRHGRCKNGYCNHKTMTCGRKTFDSKMQLGRYSMDNRCYTFRVMRFIQRGETSNFKRVLSESGSQKYKILKFIKLYFTLPAHSQDFSSSFKSDADLDIKYRAKLTKGQIKRAQRLAMRLCINVSKTKGRCGPKFGRCYAGYCDKKKHFCSWSKKVENNRLVKFSGKVVCRKIDKKIKADKTGKTKIIYEKLRKEVKKAMKKEKLILSAYKKDKQTQARKRTHHGYYNGVPKALRGMIVAAEEGKSKVATYRKTVSPKLQSFFDHWKKGTWKCWCYSDFKEGTKCTDVDQNQRPDTAYETNDEDETERGE